VDAFGRHHGGAIVPGPVLMVQSLLEQTAGIRRRARGGAAKSRGLFARSTAAALDAGARYASAALIQRALSEARVSVGVRPRLMLTGGAAPAVARLLGLGVVVEPDLVLHGLAVLAFSH
jgi:type III pantothenate kinase